jgi:hypothetical protein
MSPAITWSSVDLPQPLGPTIARNSPGSTVKLTFDIAFTAVEGPPNTFPICSMFKFPPTGALCESVIDEIAASSWCGSWLTMNHSP